MNIVEIVLGPSSNILPQIDNKKINITDAHLLLKARSVIGWSEQNQRNRQLVEEISLN